VRTAVDITDRAGFRLRVSLFGQTSAPNGVYVVAKLSRGDLVALDRAYYPMGFLIGDEKSLWQELLNHPAKFQYDADANFQGSAGITRAEGIWFNLDETGLR
jgi:hypothetical protein